MSSLLDELFAGLVAAVVLGGILGFANGFINDWIRRKTRADWDPDFERLKGKVDQELRRLKREASKKQ